MIFDTHTHYDDEAFNEDRDSVINYLKNGGVSRVVNVGASIESSRTTLELANKYDFIYASIGVHPDDAAQVDDAGVDTLKELASSKKVVAIGEIGLDYHWNEDNIDVQKEAFRSQIKLAKELSLPIIIHSRDAARDTMDIMSEMKAQEIGGVVHCFSYSREIAKEAIDMGFYIGVGGVVTFKNAKKLRECVEMVSLDRILLETDCPYMAPEPNRGKRNESTYLKFVVEKIAEIKGVSREEVEEKTYENALRLFRIN